MQKKLMKLVLSLIIAVTIMGAASAEDLGTSTNPNDVGTIVAGDAMSDLGLATPGSSSLLITTAGTASLNGQTTEDSVQAVVSTTSNINPNPAVPDAREITYGSGNLLTINDPNGPLEFFFVSKQGTNLLAKKYSVSQTGTITGTDGIYAIDINQNEAQIQAAIAAFGSNGLALINIANLWAQGAPADLMASVYTTGNINQHTMANYAMTNNFVQNYPVTVSGPYPSPSTTATRNYYIITRAGNLNDDTALYGTFGFNYEVYSTSNGSADETAFIQQTIYSHKVGSQTIIDSKSGSLALMKENDLTSQFLAANPGINMATALGRLKFNIWLLGELNNHASQFFTLVGGEVKSIDDATLNYLWYDSQLGYGHGIDESYIMALPAVTEAWNAVNYVTPATRYNDMFALGQAAYDAAVARFGGTSFADALSSGNAAVVMAPYYVNWGNASLAGFLDGIASRNSTFNIDNLLTIRNPWMWGSNLPVLFIIRNSGSNTQNLVMHGVKTTISGGSPVASAVTDISPSQIQTGNVIGPTTTFVIPAPAGLMYAWATNAPYNFMRCISRVGCICSTREYDIATTLMGQYPLSANEYYILTALTGAGETGRQISGRTTAYGVSPAQGTYYSVGQTSNPAYPVILTIWNEATHTIRTMLIQYDPSPITAAMQADGYTSDLYKQEADLFWHLDKVFNGGPESGVVTSTITTAKIIYNINRAFIIDLNAAGGDPISKMLNYVAPVTPVTPAQGTSGNSFANRGEALTNSWNLLGSSSTSTNEIAPGLPLGQNTPASAGTASSTSDEGMPVGMILGVIFLIIAAILVYLGRNTIVVTLTGYGRPGK